MAMDQQDATTRLILEDRAKRLARLIKDKGDVIETMPLLEISLIGSRFAIPLGKVNAVTRITEITAIPLAPKHIPGIIRRRGESIALVSLEYFFDSDQTGIADADYAVLVTGAGKRFALQVEDIVGVTLLPESKLIPPQDNFNPDQAPYVSAVTREGLAVLDVDSLATAKGFAAEKSAG